MLDLRTACLARERDGLRTFGDALAHADVALVEKAPQLATQLPELEACDAAALAGGHAGAARSGLCCAAREIEHALTELERDTMHGLSLDETRTRLAVANVWSTAATTFGWQPLVARARRAVAMLREDLGLGKEARAALLAAAAARPAANDSDALVAIELDLLDVEGRLTSDWALGDELGAARTRHARAPRRSAGEASRAGAQARPRAAARRSSQGRAPRTRRSAADRAHAGPLAELGVLGDSALRENDLGSSPTRAPTSSGHACSREASSAIKHPLFGSIEHDLGDHRLSRRASTPRRKACSPDRTRRSARRHTARTRSRSRAATEAIGTTSSCRGSARRGRDALQRAIKIFDARLGPDSPEVANAYNDIGGAYHRAGKYPRRSRTTGTCSRSARRRSAPTIPTSRRASSTPRSKRRPRASGIADAELPARDRDLRQGVRPGLDRGRHHLSQPRRGRAACRASSMPRGRRTRESRTSWRRSSARTIRCSRTSGTAPGQLELARGHADKALPLLERAVAMREKEGERPISPRAGSRSRRRWSQSVAIASGRASLRRRRGMRIAHPARDSRSPRPT